MGENGSLTESRVSRWIRFGLTVFALGLAWATLTNNVSSLQKDQQETNEKVTRIEATVGSIEKSVVQNAADTKVTFADVRAQIEILKASIHATRDK